jgi:outer membrane protein
MTRKLLRFLVPAALFSMSAFAQNGGGASSAPVTQTPSKVGIISIQDAIVASNEGQRDLTALQNKFIPKKNELDALTKEIDGLQTQLRTQGDKMNPDALAALQKSIETKQKQLQRQGEDAQADYNAQQGEIANRIGGKMMDVIDKYAKQNAYSLILDVSNPQTPVLWAGTQINITKDIVDAYNVQSGVGAPPPSAPGASAPAAPRPQTPRPAGAAGTATPKSPTSAAPKK